MTGTRHPFRPQTILDWRPCRRGDRGAVFTGARWTCPPFGVATVVVAAVGVAVRDAVNRQTTSSTPWRPWWARPRHAPAPDEHGPRLLFRGTPDGIEVGAL